MKHIEEDIQKECVRWFRYKYPGKLIHHSPNGGKRKRKINKYGVEYSPEATRFKAMGTLAGWPDLFIAAPRGCFAGLFIEMKYGTNKLTPAQKEVTARLIAGGYCIAVCYTIDEFKSAVTNYFAL